MMNEMKRNVTFGCSEIRQKEKRAVRVKVSTDRGEGSRM